MNQSVVTYIEKGRSQGVPDQTIRQKLIESGWAENIINESFLVSQNPPLQTQVSGAIKKEDLTSPYGELLAVVLAVCLFVLTNGIFSDITNSVSNPNSVLLYEGGFAMLFLLLALGIYNGIEDKKRFRILALPYLAVSAWLVVKLLFNIGAFILDKNAAAAVYVILGGIVVVLTGIVVFTQKKSNQKES